MILILFSLGTLMLSCETVHAIVKEVLVWGAQSINQMGNSDNKITLEELEKDYKYFEQTDGLREYFFNTSDDVYKEDLSEDLSWLIDNEIIIRDERTTVYNTKGGMPKVVIEKTSVEDLLSNYVNRSDGIMYIYKAVYGPIDARTIGVETTNIRTDNGVRKSLYDIMKDHDYFTTVSEGNKGNITQGKGGNGADATGGIWDNGSVTSGTGGHGTDGIEIIGPGYHYDEGGNSTTSGGAGGQSIGIKLNLASTWRYTPQGTKYDSIFGDTNIFISDVNIEQEVNSGHQGVYTGAHGGGGVGGNGGNNAAISYETDYKQIYYTPGADIMFYRVNDCLELYIREALTKGLLSDEKELRTEEFTLSILKDLNETSLESWSGNSYPYIFNRVGNKLVNFSPVKTSSVNDLLGVNYDIDYNNGVLNVERKNIFSSNSGYFKTEKIYKMDLYRYIYRFVAANEKKLSNLETDIVNYKYGMELEGCTRTEEDLEIIKYLIAKGILNFDGLSDFQDLYSQITYSEFIPILYRVANSDARLNFSLVQLTDSETSWKARGYAPQTMYIVSGDAPTVPSFKFNDEYLEQDDEPVQVSYNGNGKMLSSTESLNYLLNKVRTRQFNDKGSNNIILGDGEAGVASIADTPGQSIIYSRFNFDFNGAVVGDGEGNTPLDLLKRYSIQAEKSVSSDEGTLNCERYFLSNVWVISYLQNNNAMYSKCIDYIENKKLEWKPKNLRVYAFYANALSSLKNAVDTDTGVFNINISVVSGANDKTLTVLKRPAAAMAGGTSTSGGFEQAKWLAENTRSVSFQVKNNNGIVENYNVIFSGNKISGTGLEGIEQANKIGMEIQMLSPNSGSISEADVMKNSLLGLSTAASSLAIKNAVLDNQCVQTYIKGGANGGNQAFWSWSEIQQYNDRCVDTANQINIVKESDLVLYNKVTDTRAVFRVDDPKIAMVGTTIVTGDPSAGVVYKEGSGDGAEYFYYINAIRLLMNAKQEAAVWAGARATALSSTQFNDNITTVNLKSTGGHIESGITGIRALISQSTDSDFETALSASAANKYGVGSNKDTVWGDYIGLSQANRAINSISRKINYTSPSTNTSSYAYAVVIFRPADVEEIGTPKINSNDSLQDLLDAVVKEPETEEGKRVYNNNMLMCNAYANWVYGTTGGNYIKTGYLVPDVYLYYFDSSGTISMPVSIWGSLSSDMINRVQQIPLTPKMNGATVKLTDNYYNREQIPAASRTGYFLAKDYSVLVAGDRVYLEESMFPNMEKSNSVADGSVYYNLNNSTFNTASFTLGSSFKLLTQNSSAGIRVPDWAKNMRATVVSTDKSGVVTCQYGPISGTPIRYGSQVVLMDIEPEITSEGKALELSSYSNRFNDASINKLVFIKEKLFKGYNLNFSNSSLNMITQKPSVDLSNDNQAYVYTGEGISVYVSGQSHNNNKVVKLNDYSSSFYSKYTFADVKNDLQKKFSKEGYSYVYPDKTLTYITFSFDCTKYTIKDGYLVTDNAHADDLLSPSLFTNLNDLIINSMINESNGAIPINEVPDGALLKIGDGYYCSVGGSSDSKVFVGYAFLGGNTSGVFKPSIQDVSKSFANHFILGGNQYINVTHYFDKLTVLNDLAKYKDALSKVSNVTMKRSGNSAICVDSDGNSVFIVKEDNSSYANKYAPCEVIFQNILLAYPSNTLGEGTETVQVYTICNMANNSVIGALEDLPIFTDGLLEVTLIDNTTMLSETNYVPFEGAFVLLNEFKNNFEKAFTGDLYTLLRLVLFLILIWLVVASWLCYCFSFGGLMPIIDAIKYPTKDRSKGGLDLFKLITFGIISVETEFTFGKFIQYNVIISILLMIVWKSGNIVF